MTGTGLKSTIEVPAGSDFPIGNIPFGIAGFPDDKIHAVTRIGARQSRSNHKAADVPTFFP